MIYCQLVKLKIYFMNLILNCFLKKKLMNLLTIIIKNYFFIYFVSQRLCSFFLLHLVMIMIMIIMIFIYLNLILKFKNCFISFNLILHFNFSFLSIMNIFNFFKNFYYFDYFDLCWI